jgi:hypothetical protein
VNGFSDFSGVAPVVSVRSKVSFLDSGVLKFSLSGSRVGSTEFYDVKLSFFVFGGVIDFSLL